MLKESKWYVAYTYSKSEKKVNSRLQQLRVESYLPLRRVKRQWSDRVKIIEAPLFTGYIFIKTTERNIPELMSIPGIVSFISFERKFATVREKEIQMIRKISEENYNVEAQSHGFRKGHRVEIVRGPLTGLEGIMVHEKGKKRIIVSMENLGQELSLEVPTSYLEMDSGSRG